MNNVIMPCCKAYKDNSTLLERHQSHPKHQAALEASLKEAPTNDGEDSVTDVTGVTDTKTPLPTVTDCPLDEVRDTQGHTGTASDKPIPLDSLLDGLASFNRRFIYHKNPLMHDVIALWIAHTYAMDKWFVSPRLYINAPQAGAGKSTQGKVIAALTNHGIKSSSASIAFIFSKVKENDGNVTILLDEADNIWAKGRDTSDLQALINEGYEPGATVGRGNATDKGIVAVEYPSYCPVVIIGIKNSRIPDTTLSRCIGVRMTIPEDARDLQRFVAFQHREYADGLGAAVREALADLEPFTEPEGGWGRSWDIWIPLFAIADHAGGTWPKRVREAYALLEQTDTAMSPQQKVLRFSCDYFLNNEVDKATPTELAEYINGLDDMFELTGQRVSYYLRNYDLEPAKSNGHRVWRRDDVLAAGSEWVSPSQEASLSVPAVPVEPTSPNAHKHRPLPATPLSDDWKTNVNGEGW